MIKPASGLCNIRCGYCFYADVKQNRIKLDYGMMPVSTARKIIGNTMSDLLPGDKVTFAFQGGEPTLAGLAFFESFFSYAEELKGSVKTEYVIQTNGISINDDWCNLLRQYSVLIGLSVDGTADIHDQYRKDAYNMGTHKRVMAAKRVLDKHGIPYNVLTVLTKQSASHPQTVWRFLVREKIEFVQFIPCLDVLESVEKAPYSLSPERFYRFYSELFILWQELQKNGHYLSIKLFDDLVDYYTYGIPGVCGIGGKCAVHFVIESDGSAFPCDFYMIDEFYMGSLTEHKPSELFKQGEHFLAYGKGYENDEPCVSCRYLHNCGGGCKRMKDSMYISNGYCWFAKLLDEILTPLMNMNHRLRY